MVERRKISDLLFFQEGPGVRNTQYTTSGVKLLNVANLQDGEVDLSTSNRYISEEEAYGRYKHFLVDDGDFIIASSGIKVEYFEKKMGFINKSHLPLCMNTSTIRFKVLDNTRLDIRYFMYYLKSNDFKTQLSHQITGSAQLNFGPSHLKKMDLPLPTLSEQQHIAKVLDAICALIAKRKQQIALLDDAVKSLFVEMFGNYVYDQDRWFTCKVDDIADTIDPQPSHRTPPISVDGIPYIGIAECNYKTGQIDFENARKVGTNVLQEHLCRYSLHEGDFIIGKIGTIGKPFFIPCKQDYTLSANTVLIQPNKEKVSPQFLFAFFQSEYMDRVIDAEKKSTSQPAFGIQKVREIKIPLPPIELQKEFAARVKKIETQKRQLEVGLSKMEEAYGALMQEYFG